MTDHTNSLTKRRDEVVLYVLVTIRRGLFPSLYYSGHSRKIEFLPGRSCEKAIHEAAFLAKCAQVSFSLQMNGVDIYFNPNSDAELLVRDFKRAMSGCIDIVKNPEPILSPKDIEKDEEILALHKKNREENREKFQREQEKEKATFEEKIANAPEFALTKPDLWNQWVEENNDNAYNKRILEYAQDWARLMQMALVQGAKLEDIAEKTSDEADFDGITGKMYGGAVSVLSQVWKHGEKLRKWHNTKYQLGDEGEKANENSAVINPAVLKIS